MKKLLLALGCSLSAFAAQAQLTTLYSENFNGSSNTFTTNTTDESSTATGYNHWVVNSSYTGGAGAITCLNFSFAYNVGTTMSQPNAIVGSPNSTYLHILADSANADGITNANFLPADGLCNQPENYFAAMSNDISTVGYTGVTLNFWWMCAGSASNYGELYYSTDGGASWTSEGVQYNSTTTWTQHTYTSISLDNRPTLRFGFRFVNGTTNAAADPSFSIDEISIGGQLASGIAENTTATTTSFPNPFQNELTLEHLPTQGTITLTNVLGEQVLATTINSQRMTLNTASLATGVYVMTIVDGEETRTLRLVKTN